MLDSLERPVENKDIIETSIITTLPKTEVEDIEKIWAEQAESRPSAFGGDKSCTDNNES